MKKEAQHMCPKGDQEMSLKSEGVPAIPEETARLAHIVCPKGDLCLWIGDELSEVFQDQLFASLFPRRGQPAEAPWRLALITVLQFVEGLSDRQAADAVRKRIDWKYALRLPLEDLGFDFSILSEFRGRLLAGAGEQLLLDALLELAKARGWLKARGRQRTDSTHVLAAIETLSRLECVAETFRHALNVLSATIPEWVQTHVPVEWYERYATRLPGLSAALRQARTPGPSFDDRTRRAAPLCPARADPPAFLGAPRASRRDAPTSVGAAILR
jgi:transposase